MPIQLFPSDHELGPDLGKSSMPTTRRGFLAGLAAGAAGLALGRSTHARVDRSPVPDWFALVSDIHIGANPSKVTLGQNPFDNLHATVASILADAKDKDDENHKPPLGVVFDGDLALWDGQPGDYHTLLNLLEPLRKAGLPLHLALGNHDHRERFREAIRGHLSRYSKLENRHVATVEGAGVRLVVLDSLYTTAATPGILGRHQLDWLGMDLDAHPGPPTVIFVHHDPLIGTKAGLLDAQRLFDVVRPRKQVKALVFGHTHHWTVRTDEPSGIHLVNLPAVAYHFAIPQPLGWCRFTPNPGGAALELRVVAGCREVEKTRYDLRWREA